jgi:peptide/nickel transport system permease protein
MGIAVIERAAPRQRVRPAVWRMFTAIGGNYIFRRICKAIFTIFFVTTLIFFLIRLLPGNPVEVFIQQQIGQYGFSYEDAANQARSLYAIDTTKPLPLQYVDFLRHLAHGDLGHSVLSPGVPVTRIIREYLPWTLFSVGMGLLLAFTFGVGLGMLMAYRRGSALDHILSAVGSLLHSIPNYLFAIMLVVFFGVRLKWLPFAKMRGAYSSGQDVDWSLGFFRDIFYHASLPIAVYLFTGIGAWMLLMKSSTVAALDEDYVTVARARGLSDRRIAIAYVGRTAILPLFAQLTIAVAFIVGGSILVEPIFVYQGIGYILFRAIQQRDYPLMQGIFLMITASVVIANLAADLLYSRLDPRIRTAGRGR